MNRSGRRHTTSLLKNSCLSALVAFALIANAHSQKQAEAVQYSIASGDMVQVVNKISRRSGVQIVYDIELLREKKTAELRGVLTLEQALDRVLRGSGLSWSRVNPTTVTIQRTGSSKTDHKKESGDSPPKPVSTQQETEAEVLKKST